METVSISRQQIDDGLAVVHNADYHRISDEDQFRLTAVSALGLSVVRRTFDAGCSPEFQVPEAELSLRLLPGDILAHDNLDWHRWECDRFADVVNPNPL